MSAFVNDHSSIKSAVSDKTLTTETPIQEKSFWGMRIKRDFVQLILRNLMEMLYSYKIDLSEEQNEACERILNHLVKAYKGKVPSFKCLKTNPDMKSFLQLLVDMQFILIDLVDLIMIDSYRSSFLFMEKTAEHLAQGLKLVFFLLLDLSKKNTIPKQSDLSEEMEQVRTIIGEFYKTQPLPSVGIMVKIESSAKHAAPVALAASASFEEPVVFAAPEASFKEPFVLAAPEASTASVALAASAELEAPAASTASVAPTAPAASEEPVVLAASAEPVAPEAHAAPAASMERLAELDRRLAELDRREADLDQREANLAKKEEELTLANQVLVKAQKVLSECIETISTIQGASQ